MDTKKILLIGAIIAGAYYLLKKVNLVQLSGISRRQFWPQETTYTGLGASGRPRRGRPKTEAERRATHQSLFGDDNLPPRGTGLRRWD